MGKHSDYKKLDEIAAWDLDKEKPTPCCGVEPMKKINLLSTWIRCPKCGRCVAGDTYKEARREWNKASRELYER